MIFNSRPKEFPRHQCLQPEYYDLITQSTPFIKFKKKPLFFCNRTVDEMLGFHLSFRHTVKPQLLSDKSLSPGYENV